MYSTYETSELTECEANVSRKNKVIILGGGPNRIGQGIEFDYCCCQASFALKEAGYETIMINCNPETVSTDFDTSDRLYFDPLTLESVSEVLLREDANGILLQFGGQTAINLSLPLSNEMPHLSSMAQRKARRMSGCLIGASILMPGGFFLGGWVTYGGDPGLGIFLLPIGAFLLFMGVFGVASGLVKASH